MIKQKIGSCDLYLADCLEVMPTLSNVDHIISDPPYESSLHASKNTRSATRFDSGPDLSVLDFEPIDSIRDRIVKISSEICDGWFIAFCTIEGVSKWTESINDSKNKHPHSYFSDKGKTERDYYEYMTKNSKNMRADIYKAAIK